MLIILPELDSLGQGLGRLGLAVLYAAAKASPFWARPNNARPFVPG